MLLTISSNFHSIFDKIVGSPNFTSKIGYSFTSPKQGAMTDLMVSSKRPRVPSFTDKHSDYLETDQAATTAASDWLQEKEMGEVEVKNFLELCGFCKRNLCHDKDIFMYSYFGAFCSKECRAKQMACDIFRESSRGNAKTKKGRTCEGIKPKDSNDEVLGNRDRISSPRFYI